MSLNDFAGIVTGAALLVLAFVAVYSQYTNRLRSKNGTILSMPCKPIPESDVDQPNQPTQFADQVFGHCRFNGIDAYDCRLVIPSPHSTTTVFASHVWAWESVPSERQRLAFASFVSHYHELWPKIADKLSTLHPTLNCPEEVKRHLKDRVAIHLGEHSEESMELVYEFDLPNECSRGFFLRVVDLEIVDSQIIE